MENTYYIELLERYYKRQVSSKELLTLFDWINSPEGKAEYEQYLAKQLEVMEGMTHMLPHITADRMLRNIRKKAGISKSYRSPDWRKMRKYAAVLLAIVLTGSGMWLLTDRSDREVTFAVSKGNKGTLTLPDGSEVWLNAESKITYAGRHRRKIALEGEAFLQVAKDRRRQFVVNTPFADILVYGTSFNVAACPGDSVISVSLVEGNIGLQIPGQEQIIHVAPGQTARFDVRNNHMELLSNDMADVALWRNDEITLTDADIHTLRSKMEAWYSLDIRLLNRPQRNHLYNMTIRNESIGEMLELIHKVTPIKYHITGKEVTVEYIR